MPSGDDDAVVDKLLFGKSVAADLDEVLRQSAEMLHRALSLLRTLVESCVCLRVVDQRGG